MIPQNIDPRLLAMLLAASEQQGASFGGKQGLALTPSAPRSALVSELLSQSLSGPDAFMEGIDALGEGLAEGIKKRKKKKRPVRKAIPQFDVDPSGLGLVRRQ